MAISFDQRASRLSASKNPNCPIVPTRESCRHNSDSHKSAEVDLMAFCWAHLARYKCPRSIDFEVELPRSSTGKLYKRLLRDRYWGGRRGQIV
jgi:acyl-CoA synthetase (AMP-forming)/AMP-acid ligase II